MNSVFTNKFSADTAEQKYYFKDETCMTMVWRRVAKALASVEKKPEDWEDKFYEVLENFASIPGGRILSNAGLKLSGTSLLNCFSGDTECITSQGIKQLQEVVDQSVNLLSDNGEWVDAEIKYFGQQQLYKLTLQKNQQTKVIHCTANHRWFVNKKNKDKYVEKTTAELQVGDRFKQIYSHKKDNVTPSPFGIAQGFVFGDGSRGFAHLVGDKDKEMSKYFELCPKYEHFTSTNQIPIATYAQIPASWKDFPNLKEISAVLYGWLAGYFAADGCVSTIGECLLSSTNLENIFAARDVCAILGIEYFKIKTQKRISNLTNSESILYTLPLNKLSLKEDFFLLNHHKERFLADKNKIRNEKPRRFAWRLAKIEKTNEVADVYCAIVPDKHSFVLEGNILTGNCFVDGFEGEDWDSIKGIYNAVWRQAETLKSEGGYGFCSDVMRPRGAHIAGIANQSPGAVKFLELWDKSSEIITEGSGKKSASDKQKKFVRKGAQMVTMSLWHPDIYEFITAKTKPHTLSKFNMSVLVSDAFMMDVENDGDWHLLFPDYENNKKLYKEKWNGNIHQWMDYFPEEEIDWSALKEGDVVRGVKVYRVIKARDLWECIMTNAYNRNEPGVLFVDTINRMNNLSYCEHINATNPSMVADTLVLTNNGPKCIQDLENQEFLVYNPKGDFSFAKCHYSGNYPLWKVQLNTGKEYYCTAEHKWFTCNDGRKTTNELKINDKLPILRKNQVFNGNLGDYDDGFLIGWYLGDGWSTTRSDNGKTQFGLIVSEQDVASGIDIKLINILRAKTNFTGQFNSRTRDDSVWYEINTQNTEIQNYLNTFDSPTKETGLSRRLICEMSHEMVCGLIDGYLSSDGYVESDNNKRIVFTSKHKKLVEDISDILGFHGIITKRHTQKQKSTSNMFPNGKTYNKIYTVNRLVINDFASIKHFATLFSSSLSHKNQALQKLKNIARKKGTDIDYVTIKNVEFTNQSGDVWDIQVHDAHSAFYLSHAATLNCGEQLLALYAACLLGSLNLTQFVDIEKNDWDYAKLRKYIPIFLRMLDNVNDIANAPLPEQVEQVLQKRRVGMGVMGYGSALYMLKLRYGSPEALEKTEALMKFIANEQYRANALLAKEKGVFPLYDAEKYLQSKYINSVLDKDVINLIRKHGVRCSHASSCQPTGNTSVLANIISSGIEPLFCWMYIRTYMLSQSDLPEDLPLPINPDFSIAVAEKLNGWKWIKEGDTNMLRIEWNGEVYKCDNDRGYLKEESVIDYAVRLLGEENLDKAWAVTSFDLDVDDHINTLAIFAKYIDSAISKTNNVPADYPYIKFKECYAKAWQKNIKGYTTYREGTMASVLKKPDEVETHEAPERPKELPCQIFTASRKGEEYFILVGLLNDTPYELFAGKYPKDIKIKSKSGTIIKKKKGIYQLVTDSFEFDNICDYLSDNEEAITRMISTSLRFGTKLEFIVEQLEKVKGEMHSFGRVVARVLKKYIPDGTRCDEYCPECSEFMIREAGCKRCSSCAYSVCQ